MSTKARTVATLAVAATIAGCGSSPPSNVARDVAHPGTQNTQHAPGVNDRIRLIDVSIKRGRLVPKLVSVRSGVEIRWTNRDTRPHRVVSSSSSVQPFDSGPIEPGHSFRITTKHRGMLPYHVGGRGKRMRGRIEVG